MKISEIVAKLNNVYFLPSIQREFVWLKNRKEQRIEKLFDSILQDYPIGNIMTWQVDRSPGDSLPFSTYKFIENYSDEAENEETDMNGVNDPQLILDGQQRLTALLIGLKGRYNYTRYKKPCETRLYINLFADLENAEDNVYGLKYELCLQEFKDDIYYDQDKLKLWFRVGLVLGFNNIRAEDFKGKYEDIICQHTDNEEEKKLARIILGQLHYCICKNSDAINVVVVLNEPNLDREQKLDRVLNIFVRANDGGVKLEKSDLLLSFMESHQDLFQPNRARKEILGFVESLNEESVIKPNYRFTKDDILKASLMITGIDLKYKVSNFTSDNLEKISNEWIDIKESMELTVKLLAKYGFSAKNITSKNALLPIVFYIHKNKYNIGFIERNTSDLVNTREMLVRWLIKAMLTGLFGGSSDSTLEKSRALINKDNQLINNDALNADDLNDLIARSSYKSINSDLILKLVSPLDYWGDYQQDHIHPKSKFNEATFNAIGLTDEEKKLFLKKSNSIGNICLLKPADNNSKRAEDLAVWLNEQVESVKENMLIPCDISYSFSDFINFVDARERLIFNKLNSIINPN